MQCLHTSEDISQRNSVSSSPGTGAPARPGRTGGADAEVSGGARVGPRPRSITVAPVCWRLACESAIGLRCSMNATWRQVSALRPSLLSNDMPVKFSPSSGTWFHSLHATSHALQPMQSEVSVKKPIRAGCSS